MQTYINRALIIAMISLVASGGSWIGRTLSTVNFSFIKSGKIIRAALPTPVPQPAPQPTPTASPTPTPAAVKSSLPGVSKPSGSNYTSHSNIITTWFRAGTEAGKGDKGISNVPSAWYSNWAAHLGGVDDGSLALSRPGKDNLFYAALPCGDYVSGKLAMSRVQLAPWYNRTSAPADGQSIFKNRWLEVSANGKSVYVQWEDVGPLYEDDCQYVFGTNRPRMESTHAISSALDISASAFQMLESNLNKGEIKTTWRFVDASQVPAGPWKTTVTTAGPDW